MNYRTPQMEAFLSLVGDEEPLTKEQELRLGRISRCSRNPANVKWARDKLVTHNTRFAIGMAMKRISHGAALEDIAQNAIMGLISAAKTYDDRRGFSFITYARWAVRQSIQAGSVNDCAPFKIPIRAMTVQGRVSRAIEGLRDKGISNPTTEEISKEADLTAVAVSSVLETRRPRLSINEQIRPGATDGTTHLEMVPDKTSPHPWYDEALGHSRSAEAILGLLSEGREREIVEMYYGLDGGGGMTLGEIGKEYNICRERVRQLLIKARAKILLNADRDSVYAWGDTIGVDKEKVDARAKEFWEGCAIQGGRRRGWIGKTVAR